MIKRQQMGFTIVELLIVIVVIGILAAVSLVAYNGIQTRAENAKTISAVTAYAKALQIYKSDNNTYPVNNPAAFVCLPGNSGVCAAEVALCMGVGGVANTNNVINDFKTVIPAMPAPSSQKATCSGGGKLSGIFYYYAGSGNMYLYYVLKNSPACTALSGLTMVENSDGDARLCLGYTT